MILINGVEILTVLDDINWEGAKDIVTRSLSFSFLYNPQVEDMPRYNCKVGDKVEWIEGDKTLFLGYIESTQYNTDDDSISITCQDFASRLARSKFVGRMQGTLNQLADKICGSFNIKNGISVDNSHVHNIVSTGDLTYYEVLKTACDTLYNRYALYMDGDTLRLASHDIQAAFDTGINIRSSSFNQSLSDMVTRVLVIDNDGNVLNAVEDRDYFHDQIIAPYKGELEIWFTQHRNVINYFKLIYLTVLAVLKPSSNKWKTSFKDLPTIPDELKDYI